MKNFNENAIREAAYYIWQNNGCPANTSLQDWNAAINQLSNAASLSNKKTTKKSSSCAAKISSATKKSSTTKKMPQIVLTSKKKSK